VEELPDQGFSNIRMK
jgi:hypothetical protein